MRTTANDSSTSVPASVAVELKEGRRERTANSGKEDSKSEHSGENHTDVDTEACAHRPIPGDGPHLPSYSGPCEQKPEETPDDHADPNQDEIVGGHGYAEQRDRVLEPHRIILGSRIVAPYQSQCSLEDKQ